MSNLALRILYQAYGAVLWLHLFDDDIINCYHDQLSPISVDAQIAKGATCDVGICAGCFELMNNGYILYRGLGIHDQTECKAHVDEMRRDVKPLTIDGIRAIRHEVLGLLE